MKKQKQKKFKLWTLILIASLCYFTYTMYNQQINIDNRKSQSAQTQKNIHTEEIKNQQLLEQKEKINTKEFAERIAREKLGYVKDGEKIYIDTNK
jgi:cell division protein FtsB